MRNMLFTILLILTSSLQAEELELAFPTAEGYGKYTQGGRGGVIYEVTNLNDSGEGSLRAAVQASGPRIVVFKTSGTIHLSKPLKIKNSHITIDGSSAPADGICLRGEPLVIDADQVIIRYLRVRLGDEHGKEQDAISARGHKHIILDHISASWSVDETLSIYHCDSITVQWCIISESLFNSCHSKGTHGFGGIWGGNYSTYHHNLLASNSSRNPRIAGGAGFVDIRNNVIFNWGYNNCYGGAAVHKGGSDPRFTITHTDVNLVNNYYKPGPATMPGKCSRRICNPEFNIGNHGMWYVDGNVVEGNKRVSHDNWDGGVQVKTDVPNALDSIRLAAPWPAMPIRLQTAEEAYISVLDSAGCSLHRDSIDMRIIRETLSGIPHFEGATYRQAKRLSNPNIPCGIIDSQRDVDPHPDFFCR